MSNEFNVAVKLQADASQYTAEFTRAGRTAAAFAAELNGGSSAAAGGLDKATAQKRGSGQTCAPLDELAECVAAPGGVEDSFDAAETGRIISDFLHTLPEETRNIFLRRYWYCDATADIAARYGLTESKVRVTLHRTRGKLSAYLQERGAAL